MVSAGNKKSNVMKVLLSMGLNGSTIQEMKLRAMQSVSEATSKKYVNEVVAHIQKLHAKNLKKNQVVN